MTLYMVDWHRNLFDAQAAPAVSLERFLLVVDRPTISAPPLPPGAQALRCIGLDQTVEERGIAVCTAQEARHWQAQKRPHARMFQPISAKLIS